MKNYFYEILYLLSEDKRKLPALIFLFLGSSLLDLAGIGLVGPYIALVFDPTALDGSLGQISRIIGLPREKDVLLISLGISLFVIFFLKAISAIWLNYKIILFSQSQQVRLRSFLMRAYQSMPYTEYLRRNSSEYIHSTQTLVAQYSDQVLMPGLRTLSDGIVAVVVFCLLAWSNAFALSLLVFLGGSIIFFYDRLFRRKIGGFGKKANAAATMMVQAIHEGVEGLKEVRILGGENYFYYKVREASIQYSRFISLNRVVAAAPRYLLELTLISFIVMLVFVTLSLDQSMKNLIPTLGMFGVAALRLLPSATLLSANMIRLRFGRDAVSRLYKDLRSLEEIEFQPQATTHGSSSCFFSSLVLEEVSFRYPNTKQNALEQVSFALQAGESVGLIGSSGSGKTTIVDVLLGLLEPCEGAIRYNGKALKGHIAEWRSQVAYLPQQVFLIDNTLRRNIALGVEDHVIDEGRLNESLRQSCLAEFVKQLPQGLDTVLGERGVRLSGGQRQRVALARAFYHGRDVLVMDEATSALDNETEYEIVEEIKKLHGQKTMIVIAHRLTTVQHCDRIYRLVGGRIVEHGAPSEILGDLCGITNTQKNG